MPSTAHDAPESTRGRSFPAERGTSRRAIFLYRDGTLVHPRHYPAIPEELVLFGGIADGLSRLQAAGFALVVITNQSGVARGLFTSGDLERMHEHLESELAALGVRLDAIYHCPHHPEGAIARLAVECGCRKPAPGMLLRAARDLELDLAESWFVGDTLDDVEAGRRAGCRTVLVDLGTEPEPDAVIRTPSFVAMDTVRALGVICALEGLGPPEVPDYRPKSWRSIPLRGAKGRRVQSLVETVRRFGGLRAVVIGDALLDSYLEGEATRLCAEGPIPVVRKTADHRAPGGAANTAANLRAMGADVVLLGVLGSDPAGGLLRAALREQDVDGSRMVRDPAVETMHKMRILADGQYVVRFDSGDTRRCTEDAHDQLIAHLDAEYRGCDLVVISDYGYGAASPKLLAHLRALRARRPKVLVVDAKKLARYRDIGATILTPNHIEAAAAVGGSATGTVRLTLPDANALGLRLRALVDSGYIALTLADQGVLLFDRERQIEHIAAHPVASPREIGAGDSFAAATALGLASGTSAEDAVRIGVDAAAVAVSKWRTAVVSQQELLRRVSLREYASVPEAAELCAKLDLLRAAGKTVVFTNGVYDILHAGHVQLLRRAKELGDVLVVGINSDDCTRRQKGPGRPINGERDRLALVAALEAVDYALLFDEETPADLIRRLRPDIHVKGGDYEGAELPEADAVREVGARTVLLPLVDGRSTTKVIERIAGVARDRAARDEAPGVGA